MTDQSLLTKLKKAGLPVTDVVLGTPVYQGDNYSVAPRANSEYTTGELTLVTPCTVTWSSGPTAAQRKQFREIAGLGRILSDEVTAPLGATPGPWIYIDMYGLYSTTNHNIIPNSTTPQTISNLVDENGDSTVYDVTMEGAPRGLNDAGHTGSNGIFTDGDRRDSIWTTATDEIDFVLKDLDNAKTYEIRVLSSRATTGTRNVDVTIDGDTKTLISTVDDSGQIGTWTGLSPSAGEIRVDCIMSAGSTHAYINAIAIREEG